MGWLIDVGQEAKGVIALGQIATGVVAIGQMATGVIAVGQVARGFIAVGQGSVGLIAVGMGAIGVFHGTAMMGVGGRGLGLVLPLSPYWPKKYQRPDTVRFRDLESGAADGGWVPIHLTSDDDGPQLRRNGRALPARFTRRAHYAATHYVPDDPDQLYARIERHAEGLICTQLLVVPKRAHCRKRYWMGSATQFAGLIALCAAFWLIAGRPVIAAIAGW